LCLSEYQFDLSPSNWPTSEKIFDKFALTRLTDPALVCLAALSCTKISNKNTTFPRRFSCLFTDRPINHDDKYPSPAFVTDLAGTHVSQTLSLNRPIRLTCAGWFFFFISYAQ
jgi:hypothetical protein